jgi:hypothetical protein
METQQTTKSIGTIHNDLHTYDVFLTKDYFLFAHTMIHQKNSTFEARASDITAEGAYITCIPKEQKQGETEQQARIMREASKELFPPEKNYFYKKTGVSIPNNTIKTILLEKGGFINGTLHLFTTHPQKTKHTQFKVPKQQIKSIAQALQQTYGKKFIYTENQIQKPIPT